MNIIAQSKVSTNSTQHVNCQLHVSGESLLGRQTNWNPLLWNKLFTNIMLNLKIKRLDNLLLWIGWLLMPIGTTWIIDPSISINQQSACDARITRLTILFGLMSQIIVGICLKGARNPNAYSTEIALTLGQKILIFRAGANLKAIKIPSQRPIINDHSEYSGCIAEFANRCP